LDILAIRELLRFPSTQNNKMAQLYYKYGRAAVIVEDSFAYDTLSLQEMARSANKGKYSPYNQDFLEYHDQDNFADKEITAVFDDDKRTTEQRSAYILSWMQYSVVPEYMMSLLGAAERMCGNDEAEIQARHLQDFMTPTYYWNAFAANYIGSLEGVDSGGSDTIDGVMVWNLANKRAVTFNTLNDEYFAEVNDEMLDLLYAGQTQLARNDCVNFEKTTSRVIHLMLIPLIQNTIWHAIKNKGLAPSSQSEGLVIGKVLALSLLPIVAKYDKDAAAVIERNMIGTNADRPVSDGAQAVANAFYQVLDELGWGCKYVGQAEGVDACQLYSLTRIASGGALNYRSVAASAFVGLLSLTAWSW
jgi:hypothetical protein